MSKTSAVVALTALLAHAAFFFVRGAHRGHGDPRIAYQLGDKTAMPPIVSALHIPQIADSVGYDGEFYLMVAMDPWLHSRAMIPFLDSPAYRYRRVGLAALANAICFANAPCISWSIPWLLLIAIFGGSWILAALAQTYGRSAWWGLAFALSPAVMCGMPRLLPDVLCAALLLAAYRCWSQKNTGLLVVTLVAAVLVREMALLFAAALAIASAENRWRRLAIFLSPAAVLVLWIAYVRAHLGSDVAASVGQFDLPFFGIGQMLREASGNGSEPFRPVRFVENITELVALAAGAALCVARWRAKDALPWAGLLYAAVAIFSAYGVWEVFVPFARAFDVIATACLLIGLRDNDRRAIACFALATLPGIADTLAHL